MFCGLVRQCCSITQFLMKASTIRCALKILGVSCLVVSINGDLNLADVLGETHTPQHPHTLLKLSLQAHLRCYYSYYSLKLYCLNILPWKWQETSDLKKWPSFGILQEETGNLVAPRHLSKGSTCLILQCQQKASFALWLLIFHTSKKQEYHTDVTW